MASLVAMAFVGALLAEAADRNECAHHRWGSHESPDASTHHGSSHAGDAPGDAESHACMCVGDCGASTPLATAVPTIAALDAPQDASPTTPMIGRIPVLLAHILPYATAPPTTA